MKLKRNVFIFMMLITLSLIFQPAISTFAACPEDISSYWKLDETTPGTYEDFIKDNDGTGNDNPAADSDGIVNGAQAFDVADTTGIDVAPDSSFNWLVDESFSIEFWVRRNGAVTGDNQVAIGRVGRFWVGIGGDNDVTVNQNAAVFFLTDNNGGSAATLKGTTDITDNEWHHVVAVRDRSLGANGQNRLYVDGQEESNSPMDATYDAGFDSATAELTIGYLNVGSFFRLTGGLDEVALYGRALTLAEIQAHYANGQPQADYCSGAAPFDPFPEDTISLWDLDETTPGAPGGTYEDAFNGNDGTGNDNPAADSDGIVNGAQAFDVADTTGIDVAPDSSFNWLVDESFSIEFWVRRNGAVTGDNQVAIGRVGRFWVGIGGDNDVTVNQNAAVFFLTDNNGGSAATLKGTTDITDNEWHHVVAVRDRSLGANGQNRLYVDGQEESNSPMDATYDAGFDSATAELTIGYLNVGSFFRLTGGLDEVALYGRALTATEIEDHYENGLLGIGIDDTGGGIAEIIGTGSSGIRYRNVAESSWTQMTSSVTDGDIAAGDFTGDGKADVASIWPSGLWYQNGDTLKWTKITSSAPNRVTAGDVTGDDRDEIIGTWSSGIWYRDVAASSWTKMTASVTDGDIAAGDFTGDGKADVASIWPSGLWYQDGATLVWTKVGTAPNSVTAGDVTGDGRDEIIGTWSSGIWYRDVAASRWTKMTASVTDGDIAAGDFTGDGKADVASIWPSGLYYQDGDTLAWTKIPDGTLNKVTAGDVTGD